jgi:antitoxin VapB
MRKSRAARRCSERFEGVLITPSRTRSLDRVDRNAKETQALAPEVHPTALYRNITADEVEAPKFGVPSHGEKEHVYTLRSRCILRRMATAKVFKSGNSQAVRLPKEFRFSAKEVEIERRGNEVVLTEKRKSTAFGRRLLRKIQALPEDFIAALEEIERSDRPPEPVEPLNL